MVELWLHNHLDCGGENVYIELSQGEISCETSYKVAFSRGAILSWTGPELETCLGKDFNIEQDHLYFKLRSASADDFCPKILTISLDNGYSFKRTGMIDWVDRHKGHRNRIAKRVDNLTDIKPSSTMIITSELNFSIIESTTESSTESTTQSTSTDETTSTGSITSVPNSYEISPQGK